MKNMLKALLIIPSLILLLSACDSVQTDASAGATGTLNPNATSFRQSRFPKQAELTAEEM